MKRWICAASVMLAAVGSPHAMESASVESQSVPAVSGSTALESYLVRAAEVLPAPVDFVVTEPPARLVIKVRLQPVEVSENGSGVDEIFLRAELDWERRRRDRMARFAELEARNARNITRVWLPHTDY